MKLKLPRIFIHGSVNLTQHVFTINICRFYHLNSRLQVRTPHVELSLQDNTHVVTH